MTQRDHDEAHPAEQPATTNPPTARRFPIIIRSEGGITRRRITPEEEAFAPSAEADEGSRGARGLDSPLPSRLPPASVIPSPPQGPPRRFPGDPGPLTKGAQGSDEKRRPC